jgi:hypothetical protein
MRVHKGLYETFEPSVFTKLKLEPKIDPRRVAIVAEIEHTTFRHYETSELISQKLSKVCEPSTHGRNTNSRTDNGG